MGKVFVSTALSAALMALSDAVSSCGDDYPDLQAPATAEEVLKTVQRVAK